MDELTKLTLQLQTDFQVVLTVAQWKGPFFKGQGHIGSFDSLLCYLQVQLRQMTINEHANVGLPRVILVNKVAAFNSIK